MKRAFTNLIFVSLLWFGSEVWPTLSCPPQCGCENKGNGFKVDCNNLGLKEPVNPDDLPENTLQLDLSRNEIESIGDFAFKGKNVTRIKKLILSGNGLKKISQNAFSGLNKLTKLDLSQNKLTSIPGDVFRNLRNIKILDLSQNHLFVLNKTQFNGCKNLRIIQLSSNKLSLLPDGLFSSLGNVQKIDLQLNRLICDCNLKWMVKWIANMKSKGKNLNVLGRCELPYVVKDKKIMDLDKKKMVCADDLELPVRSFGPQGDQIAFKGDSYSFECNSTWIPGTQISWYKDNNLITGDPNNKHINLLFKSDPGKAVVSTVLDLKQLTVADNGYYSCHITHQGGYEHISTSRLLIIPSNAQYCRAATTKTDRGTFHWHHTAAGGAAFLPCPVGIISSLLDHGGDAVMARRNCSLEGVWMKVEAQSCVHVNEITRALHNLKEKVVNDTTVGSVSEQLLNISKRAKEFSDPLDIVYAAVVVDHLVQVIGRDKILNSNLVDTMSNIMEADTALLHEAQRRSKACSSMVILLDLFATRFPMDILPDIAFVSENIAVYVVRISESDVVGKMCYVKTDNRSRLEDIDCLPCNRSCEKQMLVDTSIYLPSSLFQQMPSEAFTVKFQFIVYSNSKLFPEITNETPSDRTSQVTSSVVSAQFGGIQLTNLSHPVILKFRNHQNGTHPIPVYWEHDANGGLGSWKKNVDCKQLSSQGNSTVTKCSQLSNKNFFAVMMNVSKTGGPGITNESEYILYEAVSYGSLELVVFVGAGISSLFILATLIVYAVIRIFKIIADDHKAARELRFDRDDAAMLMNQCLSLLVTIVVFVTGINHVSNTLVCRSVGVLLHYFSLCSLLWIGCSGICLHRLIRTSIQPEEFNPILRYYMMSWGIPLIICGITIAGNMENYKVEDYCWLRLNPFYGAFLGPACLITLVDLIIFLRLFNLIKRTYKNDDVISQAGSEAEAEAEPEAEAEENALVSQPNPQPSAEENGVSVDKSTLPDRGEMMDLLRGNCVILLVIAVNIALGIFLVGYQQPRALYITLSCLFAAALVTLGALIFVFHCYRKNLIRLLWNRYCCKCRCSPGKKYQIQQESTQGETAVETADGETAANAASREAEQFSGEEIHGAKSLGDGDSMSNVSLPSSAAITLDTKCLVVALPEKEVEAQTEKASSVSDKQSWASAPLPLQYKRRGKLLKKPPGYRHSYTENERQTPTIAECRRAPLAPPEGTVSSIDSSVQFPTDTASNVAPSEGPSSVRDAADALNISRNTNTSCSASEVSIPVDIPSIKKRPPIPGSSSQGSDGAAPLPFQKNHQSVPTVRNTPSVSRPVPANQDLVAHYSIAEGTTNSIPRQIPRDHVVVRERYHIPYEPRAVSEKPRDHYQILPLPTNRRDHYLLQPGHDQYQDPRGQHLGPNPHNQYQLPPEHYPIPGDQNHMQRTYDLNQMPSPTQARHYEYFHMPRDTTHDLYQMARDLAPPRSYDSYQAPCEQSPGQGTPERYQGHSPGQRSHEQVQKSPEHHAHMSHDPGFGPRSLDHPHLSHDPKSPDHMSHDPNFGPKSPDHNHVSHDSSFGQRSHDNYVVPRDHVLRDQHPTDRAYENIPLPSEQSSVQKPQERNACHRNDLPHDPSQTARDQGVTSDTGHGSAQEYAGEGPREQPQAVNPGEKTTTADKMTGVPLDKNGVRAQNTSHGTREQPNGVRVPRRRRRNPYQIAREIHHNLGIETRTKDRQSRRSNRVPGEQRAQSQKNSAKTLPSSPVETPKERTPRSSMSSWKEERPKAKQKECVPEQPMPAVFVPVPHLKRTTPEPPRNETSV